MYLDSLQYLLAAVVTTPGTTPQWLAVAMAALAAGTLTRKQYRKLKWRLAWELTKSKLGLRKREKGEGKTGLIILMVLLLLVCFGTAIFLGMLKEFLILAGACILLFILLAGAFKREHGHLSAGRINNPEE